METFERAHRALRAMMMKRLPGSHAESEFTLSSLSVFMMAPTSLAGDRPSDSLERYLASEGIGHLRRPIDVQVHGPALELVAGADVSYQRGTELVDGRRGQFA